MHVSVPAVAAARQSTRLPAALALFFGLFVVVAAGFASPSMIHNATHDTRHAFGLPCH